MQFRLQPLGTRSLIAELRAAAVPADVGRPFLTVAVMANQLTPSLMEGQRDAAVGTFTHLAAYQALKIAGKTTPIQQQHRLLSAPMTLFQGLQKRR